MDLTLRSHSVNNMAFSKLLYRCNIIDIRVADISYFNKIAKSFIYSDLLIKPQELTLYRPIDKGGLGLLNIQLRAKAALINTFLQTACNEQFQTNYYHQDLFRLYIEGDNINKIQIPQNFKGDFFPTIRRLKSQLNLKNCNIREIYKA